MEEIYKATTQVGRDIVEAEYFILSKAELDLGLNMSEDTLWEKIWDEITIPFCRVKNKIKDIYYEVYYGFQRMFKGYDCVETFETFSTFIERYEKILTEYKNCMHSYPACMTWEEWNNIVDEMIYRLHYMNEDNVIDELRKNVSEDWYPNYKTTSEIMNRHKDEFFKLFSEYFFDLWD